jgi:hypothetical protein
MIGNLQSVGDSYLVAHWEPENMSEHYHLLIAVIVGVYPTEFVPFEKTAFAFHPECPDHLKSNYFLDSEICEAHKDASLLIERVSRRWQRGSQKEVFSSGS